jgi:DNA polymerase III alpha subunit
MDIDIDTPSTFDPLKVFGARAVRASMVRNDELVPHVCGVYLQDVPTDPQTKLCAIPYDKAADYGCFKVDFLHLSIYDKFTSRADIKELIKIQPDWQLLQIPSVVQKLFQLAKHHDVLVKLKPSSVIELADCLALIRPQKRYLLDLYVRDRALARTMLYTKEGAEGYGFKKAHAIAYAYVIVLQLHLLKAGIEL